jgi:hypothetical protein
MKDDPAQTAAPPVAGHDGGEQLTDAPSAGADEGDDGNETLITDDISDLIDSGRTYIEAELAFQKTRASLTVSNSGKALVAVILALVLLHIALIALAVGAVLALQPLVTIWGAIGIVVGVLLLGVAALVRNALQRGRVLAAMFSGKKQA